MICALQHISGVQIGALTVAAALTRDMLYNLHAKLCAKWAWNLLKSFPQPAQALLNVNIPVDWDYLKSDEDITQMF
jgi:broad specificity polyphosphatase/5'/3'-nucleotidase SurE